MTDDKRTKGAALTGTSPSSVAPRRVNSAQTALPLEQPQPRLVIFTRYPEPGTTKTRMIPALGAAGAAELQREMTQHTLRWAERLRRNGRVSVEVRFTGGDATRMGAQFGSTFAYRPQPSGDLGQRMARTFAEAFAAGARRVLIVGTDCPELSAESIEAAFALLEERDVVFGPATDGGYYLIGLRRAVPELFERVAWGSEEVFSASLRIAARSRLSVGLLKPLDDVDRPEDLWVWQRARIRERRRLRPPTPSPLHEGGGGLTSTPTLKRGASRPTISVIIPALNEAKNLPGTLAHVLYAPNSEVIVVDGGSTDETAAIARACGAKLLCSRPGRGRQMNAGAAVANGKLLLFVHADTRLDEDFDAALRETLSDAGNVAGAFTLSIGAKGRALRLVERGVRLRSRTLGMPYGDQALFMRAKTFREIGGYAELPIMEDVELVRRLRRRGRIAVVGLAARTSARRWRRMGVCRTTLLNQICLGAFLLGVSPARIARWYARRVDE